MGTHILTYNMCIQYKHINTWTYMHTHAPYDRENTLPHRWCVVTGGLTAAQ